MDTSGVCKFENFVLAFDSGCGGCRRRCRCGREFYDAGNSSYDWDEGEFEALEADSKATPLGYSVGTISLDGSEYALDCDCWHKRAEMIMKFIDGHAHAIAQYLTLEKQRKQDSHERREKGERQQGRAQHAASACYRRQSAR